MNKLQDAYIDRENASLKISVINIEEFKKLIIKAKIEAQQLTKTVEELENFKLDIKFE